VTPQVLVVGAAMTRTIIIATEKELGSLPLTQTHNASLIVVTEGGRYRVLKSRFTKSGQDLNREGFKDFMTSFLDYI